jgi:hypothetical protein
VETLQACVTSRYEPTKMTAIKTWQTDITAAAASSVSRRPFSLCFQTLESPHAWKLPNRSSYAVQGCSIHQVSCDSHSSDYVFLIIWM